MSKYLVYSLFLFVNILPAFSQDSILPSYLIRFGYGLQWPIGNLSNRFGQHANLFISTTKKINAFEFGPSFQYFFGAVVKEDVLNIFRSKEGDLIGSDHQIADVELKMRGMELGMYCARDYTLNKNSSLVFGLSPIWLVHWIRFQNISNNFEPIRGDKAYAYDRLSSGFGVKESIAFRYHSDSRLINFEIALQFLQAGVSLQRSSQADHPGINKSKHTDALAGIQGRWIIPIYVKKDPEKIYY